MWTEVRRWFQFDTTAVLMKLCYFLGMGREGAILPYLTVFLTSTGLNLQEASLISGLQFVLSIVSTQVFAYIADLTGRKSLVFATLTFLATLVLFPMPWFATLTNISPLNISNNNTLDVDPSISYQSNLFYVMLVTVVIGFSFSNPLNGFIDSFVMTINKSDPEKYDYGKQRCFGVLGFGLLNFIASILSELDIEASLSPYLGVFIIFLPAMMILIPTVVILEQRGSKCLSEDITSDQEEHGTRTLLAKVFRLFLDLDNFMFLLSFLVAGVCNTAILGFLFKFMADELKASKTTMGIGMIVAALAEIVLLVVSSQILSLFQDPISGVMIAVFAYALRFLLIAVLTNPWHIVMTQVLNAPTFSLVWASSVAHTKAICPPEIIVSVFSLLNNIFFNVGGLVGYWAGGAIYSAFGSKIFFLSMSYFVGVWFLLMVTYFKMVPRMHAFCSTKSAQKNVAGLNISSSSATIETSI